MSDPHADAAWVRPEVVAIRAMAAGTADAHQQRLALAAIGQKACLIDEISYVPGGPEADRATAFAEGRRFVGAQIRRAIRLPIEQFPPVDHTDDDGAGPTRARQKPGRRARHAIVDHHEVDHG